jgi:hypothetical protein
MHYNFAFLSFVVHPIWDIQHSDSSDAWHNDVMINTLLDTSFKLKFHQFLSFSIIAPHFWPLELAYIWKFILGWWILHGLGWAH